MATDRPAALALTLHRSARSSRRSAAAHATVIAVAAAVVASGLALPVSLVGLLGSVGLLGVVAVRVGRMPLRAALAARAIARERERRRAARERRLAWTTAGHVILAELTRLVDDIERRDPALARRLDLEALLDRYVELTLAHEAALRAVSLGDRVQLERIRETCLADPETSPRRLELCERRLRCLAHCEARVNALADDLAIVADMVKLIAQRVACPEELVADDTIERDLVELDDDDATRRQLAAELR